MAIRQFALDLTRYHERFQHGDITVFATWFGDNLSPCLVLTPTYSEGHEKSTPCVVPLAAAWMWSESIGDGAHCAQTSSFFSKSLGFSPDINSAMRVCSLIRSHIGTLLAIPPAPFDRVVVADAIRTNANGKQSYSEVTEIV